MLGAGHGAAAEDTRPLWDGCLEGPAQGQVWAPAPQVWAELENRSVAEGTPRAGGSDGCRDLSQVLGPWGASRDALQRPETEARQGLTVPKRGRNRAQESYGVTR